jgi:glycosyltransferase involved in cell wall biosynthesis
MLNQCDVFVHPAYAEGFGIVIPEAMMAEKPIIVSNAGALPELIENEKTGLVVDPHNAQAWADAILSIIDNKEFAKGLALKARLKAEADFTISKYVENYRELYTKLIIQ